MTCACMSLCTNCVRTVCLMRTVRGKPRMPCAGIGANAADCSDPKEPQERLIQRMPRHQDQLNLPPARHSMPFGGPDFTRLPSTMTTTRRELTKDAVRTSMPGQTVLRRQRLTLPRKLRQPNARPPSVSATSTFRSRAPTANELRLSILYCPAAYEVIPLSSTPDNRCEAHARRVRRHVDADDQEPISDGDQVQDDHLADGSDPIRRNKQLRRACRNHVG